MVSPESYNGVPGTPIRYGVPGTPILNFSELGMVSPELLGMVSPELLGMVSPELLSPELLPAGFR